MITSTRKPKGPWSVGILAVLSFFRQVLTVSLPVAASKNISYGASRMISLEDLVIGALLL